MVPTASEDIALNIHASRIAPRVRNVIAFALLLAVGAQAHAALNVLACEPEWASLATEIGGDRVNVSSATTATQDPHRIEARPSLIARMRNADLVVPSRSFIAVTISAPRVS